MDIARHMHHKQLQKHLTVLHQINKQPIIVDNTDIQKQAKKYSNTGKTLCKALISKTYKFTMGHMTLAKPIIQKHTEHGLYTARHPEIQAWHTAQTEYDTQVFHAYGSNNKNIHKFNTNPPI